MPLYEVNVPMVFNYFLPKTLLIIRMIIAIIATTIKIPTPTPALNIPSITEQLVNEINTMKSINNLVIFFCMGFYFLVYINIKVQNQWSD
jgi:hypothetical protein